jgi:hypothetical protein
MISLARPEPRLSVGLIGAIVLLGAAAIWPWIPGSRSTTAAATEPPAAEAKDAAAFKLPPFETFTAAVERPLFSPSRRPGPAGPAPVPVAQAPYRLIGIVVAGAHRRALIGQAAAPPIEVGEGDSFEGRTVKRIDQNRIVFADAKGNESVLTLAPPPSRRPR